MGHGHEINYYGEGEPMIDGEAGDLMVKLRFELVHELVHELVRVNNWVI